MARLGGGGSPHGWELAGAGFAPGSPARPRDLLPGKGPSAHPHGEHVARPTGAAGVPEPPGSRSSRRGHRWGTVPARRGIPRWAVCGT